MYQELVSQGKTRRLMRPEPPKREEELAEHTEMRQRKMRRLDVHGYEYKWATVF